jgi:exopolyphosphatase/guanosine-5'-triphosphate,3'-diphosphate pyrophosphatase
VAPESAPATIPPGDGETPPRLNGAATNGHANLKPVARPEGPFYGALDLGTNNCRLLIATPRERGFRVVDAFSRIVRLGEGLGQTGNLGEAAMERAIEALKVCGAKLADRNVVKTRLIATEACRIARNGAAFLERVREETGLWLEVVSQETEARLAVAGCGSLVDPKASGALLFDIGGGSSELVWIDLRQPTEGRRRIADRIRSWVSLPLGVVSLAERHGGEIVPRPVFEAMVGEVADLLDLLPEVAELDRAVAEGGVHMLGTSGTVTTLAGIHLGLKRYDRRMVDGVWLTGGEVGAVIDQLVETDYDGRIANPCIGKERADLVIAGCAILEAFHRRWPVERLRVADRGLREGMLVDLMSRDRVWQRPRPAPSDPSAVL